MTGTGGREIDDLDRAGYLEWERLFGDASAAGEDLVTVYALLPELCLDESSPVTLGGAHGERRRYGGEPPSGLSQRASGRLTFLLP